MKSLLFCIYFNKFQQKVTKEKINEKVKGS
jgi:hypothetical protein